MDTIDSSENNKASKIVKRMANVYRMELNKGLKQDIKTAY
jgi:hypothetical protein